MVRVSNDLLLDAGLKLMAENGKPLAKLPSRGRAMLYQLENGDTVRARTCNDHILIAVADSPSPGAKLNIEGTDWLLIVMPEIPRTPGAIIGYLIPTDIAVQEVRATHKRWLESGPKTRGDNTTWNLWFGDAGPEKAAGYAKKWAQYRLKGMSDTSPVSVSRKETGNPIKAEVDAARMRIAKIAGVPLEAVRISIDFQS